MTDYIYSKAAATRIFGKQAQAVTVEGDRAITLFTDGTIETTSTAQFKEHFAEYRREQGKNLSPLREDDSIWLVSRYSVTVHPDHLTCTCKDWRNQRSIGIKRPTCKHCYSVLYRLGCNSLADYLEKSKKARESEKAANQTSESSLNLTSSVSPKLTELPTYILHWETYGRDRAGNPLKTAVDKVARRLTPKDIHQFRKDYHCIGFKLTSIEQVA